MVIKGDEEMCLWESGGKFKHDTIAVTKRRGQDGHDAGERGERQMDGT